MRKHSNSSQTAQSEGRTEDKTVAPPVGGITTEKEEGSAVLPAVAVAKDSGKRDDEHTK